MLSSLRLVGSLGRHRILGGVTAGGRAVGGEGWAADLLLLMSMHHVHSVVTMNFLCFDFVMF